MKKSNLILTAMLMSTSVFVNAQTIIIDQTQTPTQLVNNVLVGTGVVVSNIEFNYSVPLAAALPTFRGTNSPT